MNPQIGLDQCLTFINCQLQPRHTAEAANQTQTHFRAITISRQSGAGGHSVAARLIELLDDRRHNGGSPWTVFDRNLVEKVLEEHHLPSRLARFMPEDRISEVTDAMDELFGLHPPSRSLVHQSAETILRLADAGNVILIGRGANVITSKLDYVFHVRLVGSVENRIGTIQRLESLTQREASAFVYNEDLGRSRYLKKYFGKDIDDPLLYHLIINTDLVSYEQAARLIADQVMPGRQWERGAWSVGA